jgi:hypothetical protein
VRLAVEELLRDDDCCSCSVACRAALQFRQRVVDHGRVGNFFQRVLLLELGVWVSLRVLVADSCDFCLVGQRIVLIVEKLNVSMLTSKVFRFGAVSEYQVVSRRSNTIPIITRHSSPRTNFPRKCRQKKQKWKKVRTNSLVHVLPPCVSKILCIPRAISPVSLHSHPLEQYHKLTSRASHKSPPSNPYSTPSDSADHPKHS